MLRRSRAYLLIFISILFETSFATAVSRPVLFPHLSLIIVIYAALSDGPASGLRCGLFTGLLLDLLSTEVFGTYTALYAFTGGICGTLRGKVFAEAFVSQWVIPAAAYAFILVGVILPDTETRWSYTTLFVQIIRHSPFVVTLLVSPAVFWICRRFLKKTRHVSTYVFLK